MKTPRVSRFVAEHPWAILPERLETILAILDRHDAGAPMAEDVRAAIAAARRADVPTGGAVAVLPLAGVLVPRASLMSEMSGGTALEGFTRAVRSVAADPAIQSLVLDVDSPGGSVFGVEEAAAAVSAAAAVKPVVAVVNHLAASAAYWIASQAREVVVTPSGQVGSIGVVAVHDDLSKAAEQAGVTRTFISAGKYKVEGHEFAPLDDTARTARQAVVDAYYETFVKAVASGRGVAQRAVRDGFGEGRMVLAEPARAQGMVDRIDTLDATIARLAAKRPKAAPAAALKLEMDLLATRRPIAP